MMSSPLTEEMYPPDNVRLIDGEIASYWMDIGGILYSVSKSSKRTVQNIADNVALVKQITGCKRVPLLIYLTNSPVPDTEAPKFATEKLPEIYSAMAMVSQPWLARVIMTLLFGFKPPPIPMRSFSDEHQAESMAETILRR